MRKLFYQIRSISYILNGLDKLSMAMAYDGINGGGRTIAYVAYDSVSVGCCTFEEPKVYVP